MDGLSNAVYCCRVLSYFYYRHSKGYSLTRKLIKWGGYKPTTGRTGSCYFVPGRRGQQTLGQASNYSVIFVLIYFLVLASF